MKTLTQVEIRPGQKWRRKPGSPDGNRDEFTVLSVGRVLAVVQGTYVHQSWCNADFEKYELVEEKGV